MTFGRAGVNTGGWGCRSSVATNGTWATKRLSMGSRSQPFEHWGQTTFKFQGPLSFCFYVLDGVFQDCWKLTFTLDHSLSFAYLWHIFPFCFLEMHYNDKQIQFREFVFYFFFFKDDVINQIGNSIVLTGFEYYFRKRWEIYHPVLFQKVVF